MCRTQEIPFRIKKSEIKIDNYITDWVIESDIHIVNNVENPVDVINKNIRKRKRQHSISATSKRKCTLDIHRYNYPYVLIVIDMQYNFEAANDVETIQNVIQLIEQAKADNAFVIVARFMKKGGETIREILNCLDTYDEKTYCTQYNNDKSCSIINKMIKHNIKTSLIKVCGVNKCACVLCTVYSLSDEFIDSKIEIFDSACNCKNYICEYADCSILYRNHSLYRELNRLHNVRIIY